VDLLNANKPLVECCGITKVFGERFPVQALADVSFAVSEGEQVCITGTSGSGKTTLLNIIGGLQSPTTGVLRIRGKPLSDMTKREIAAMRANDIGFIFQAPALIPILSARENIEYALRLGRPNFSAQQRTKCVAEALSITKLEARQDLRPGELSGGECQRVAIARAIVKKPALILADEPTSHLDDDNTEVINSVFRQLQMQHQSTIIIATHDARILSLGARTIRLSSGHMQSAASILRPAEKVFQ